MLKVHILCCGIRYGLGEGALYHHFKQAWMQKIQSLQYVGKGNNLCPTIHIIDLARLAKRVIDDDIIKPYIFAVDRTKNPTQKRIVQAISNGIGTGKVVSEDSEKIP